MFPADSRTDTVYPVARVMLLLSAGLLLAPACAGDDDGSAGVSQMGLHCADGVFYWDGKEFESCDQCPDPDGCVFAYSTTYDYPGGQQTVVSESVTATCAGQSSTIADEECSASAEVEPEPAAEAVAESPGMFIQAGCLSTPAPVADGDLLSCALLELAPAGNTACSCDAPGRSQATSALVATAREALSLNGYCSGAMCDDFCACEFAQATGNSLDVCQQSADELESGSGFCYVDAEGGLGNADLVTQCSPGARRLLRFADPPLPGAVVWSDCKF
jgi:hypothetical protein